jgi:hypothetical protein
MLTTLASLLLVTGANPAPRECQLDVRVTRIDPAAARSEREKLIAEPRVVTHFGRPAIFRLGELRPRTEGISGPGFELVSGIELEVIALRQPDGRVRLEMQVMSAGSERGSRAVIELKLGAMHRFRGPEGYWIEVTATERPAEK